MSDDNQFLDTTIEEWRTELIRMNALYNNEGYTTKELAVKFGLSERNTSRIICRLIQEGKCKVGKAKRKMLSGIMRIVPVYQLIKEEPITTQERR